MRPGFGIDGDGTTPLYRVVPGASSEPWADERVDRCPIAETRHAWIGEAMSLRGNLALGGVTLRDCVAHPSAQCLEALRVLQSETDLIRADLRAPKE